MATPHLHHHALDRLGRDIVAGRAPAGSVLTLAGLEERYGVSRTVAREIMRVLEALGMVVSRRRVGIIVQPRTSWSTLDPRVVAWRLAGPDRGQALLELTELRAALQPSAAALAARYATRAQRERLVELAERIAALAGTPESPEAVAADTDFQSLLLRAGRNEVFASIADVVRLVQRGVEPRQRAAADDPRWAARYRGIAVAVASGDEDLARRWSHDQVRAVLRAVSAAVRQVRPEPEERPGVEGWSV